MALQGLHQAVLAEFLAVGIEGFRYAIGVEREGVAGRKSALTQLAFPLLKNAQNRSGGIEAREAVVGAENQSRKMAAVGVSQLAGSVVIFGEEKSSEGAIGGVFPKEPVDGTQEMIRLMLRDGAEAAQIGLQVGHQESGGDAFSGDVADN